MTYNKRIKASRAHQCLVDSKERVHVVLLGEFRRRLGGLDLVREDIVT
jgi:hypothetical protein